MLTEKNAVVVIIDVQGKLAHMMHDTSYIQTILSIIQLAKLVNLPIIVTEQAPEKIGSTFEVIRSVLPSNSTTISKNAFSCYQENSFRLLLRQLKRRHVIVVGIESHVCVYQTVRDLLKAKFCVQIMVDGISARSKLNYDIGIQRSVRDGAIPTTIEMVLTELLVSTHHPQFREAMKLLKQNQS